MKRITKRQKFFIGTALLIISAISSVVAGTVTINTSNRVEFGQALYQVGACESFVDITADSDGTNMHRIFIDGLDISNCPDTYVRIKFYGSGNVPLNLYQDSGTAVNRILLKVTDPTDPFNGLDFLNARGLIPDYQFCTDANTPEDEAALLDCKQDGFLRFDYIGGRYILTFTTPMAAAGLVSNFTVETSKEKPDEVVACNKVIGVTKMAEGSNLKSVYLDGLDISSCPDTYIRIRFFNGDTRLDLYQDTATTVSNRILLYVKPNPTDLFNDVTFRNSLGQIPPITACPADPLQPNCKTDGFLSLDYLAGRYTITFTSPLANFTSATRNVVDTSRELPPN